MPDTDNFWKTQNKRVSSFTSLSTLSESPTSLIQKHKLGTDDEEYSIQWIPNGPMNSFLVEKPKKPLFITNSPNETPLTLVVNSPPSTHVKRTDSKLSDRISIEYQDTTTELYRSASIASNASSKLTRKLSFFKRFGQQVQEIYDPIVIAAHNFTKTEKSWSLKGVRSSIDLRTSGFVHTLKKPRSSSMLNSIMFWKKSKDKDHEVPMRRGNSSGCGSVMDREEYLNSVRSLPEKRVKSMISLKQLFGKDDGRDDEHPVKFYFEE